MEKNELKDLLENKADEVNLKGELRSPLQREAEKEFEEWKKEKIDYTFIEEFKIPQELINVLLKTSENNGLVLSGEGGIGKTLLVLSYVKNNLNPNEWAYNSGYTTTLSLYEFLYKNKDKKLIILDDLEGVFNNPLSLSILKGALYESGGKRICCYSSTSDKALFPDKFIMKAKIISLCNSIKNENDISIRATLSRTITYKINFNFDVKMKMCLKFINEDDTLNKEQKDKIIELLNNNINQATKDFNFRTLRKLISFVKYDENKAEELIRATTEEDERVKAYLEAIAKFKDIPSQIAYFMERSGRKRDTFYRIKKKVGGLSENLMVSGYQTNQISNINKIQYSGKGGVKDDR